nr:hypothetical protein [Myxococcota bacterium]
MTRAIAVAIGGTSLALAVALGVALVRVRTLESRELEASSAWAPLREWTADGSSARLLEATLLRGDEVTFELCSADDMAEARWSGAAELAVTRVDDGERMFAVPIDARMLASAARSDGASCVTFARVDALAIDDASVEAAVEVAWDAPPETILDVPVRARILARRALGSVDLAIVISALMMAIAVTAVLAVRAPRIAADAADGGSSRRGALRAIVGLGVV